MGIWCGIPPNYPMMVTGIVNVYIGIEIDDPIAGLTDAQRKLAGDYCKKHNLGTPELIEHELCD